MIENPVRRLAAILSADVAGYSRLMATDEALTVRTVNAYRELVEAQVREHGGHLVDFIGDNFLAEFPIATLADGAYVAGYWPINDELDCRSLLTELHERGCRCLLPVVGRKGEALVFRSWQPGLSLVTSHWGIGEPGPERSAHDPDIMLAPLLAYDDQGWRLGYGGGFYDRSLAALRAQKPQGTQGIRAIDVGAGKSSIDADSLDSTPKTAA